MLESRKVNGKHFEYLCSECHKTIDIFDQNCYHCNLPTRSKGGNHICSGKIAYGCISNTCPHSHTHSKKRDCGYSFCESVNHFVTCVNNQSQEKNQCTQYSVTMANVKISHSSLTISSRPLRVIEN